jgi:hypothetical protein
MVPSSAQYAVQLNVLPRECTLETCETSVGGRHVFRTLGKEDKLDELGEVVSYYGPNRDESAWRTYVDAKMVCTNGPSICLGDRAVEVAFLTLVARIGSLAFPASAVIDRTTSERELFFVP